ncbi:MAG: TRAP transporter large permease subunit [Rhizobiales bacterium]|nr:TRAP transporter large permease subunit [Hyphomicrobiales bacterium]
MDQLQMAILLIVFLFLILSAGVWIGLALLGVAAMGMALFTTRPIGDAMVTTIWTASSSWTLTALPLFIWMGEILFHSRLSEDMFRGLAPWMRRIPGGLIHTNIIGCTIFAAISGSSAATAATIGKMTLPELKKRGYPDDMVIGSLSGAGTLGLLIPPSLIMIVYGVVVNESIAKLFIAGVIPGLMLAGSMMLAVMIWATVRAKDIPPPDPPMSFGAKLYESRRLIPVVLLIALVLGSIYTGLTTATEAAVMGVVGALLLAILQGSFGWSVFADSLMSATRTSALIAFILAGATFLTLSMGFTGLPRALAQWIATLGLTKYQLILALTVFYIILGCFLDGISMVVLTMAVVEPMVRAVGVDMLWFGIFMTIVVEAAQITPPVGFNLFVLQGMTGKNVFTIGRYSLPFLFCMVLVVVSITVWPEIVLWLPSKL